jgi:hypothetical protein
MIAAEVIVIAMMFLVSVGATIAINAKHTPRERMWFWLVTLIPVVFMSLTMGTLQIVLALVRLKQASLWVNGRTVAFATWYEKQIPKTDDYK